MPVKTQKRLGTRFNHMVRATFLKQRRHIGELNARIEDSLLGERVVKAFGGEDLEREKFEQDNGRFLDIKKETYRALAETTCYLLPAADFQTLLELSPVFQDFCTRRLAALLDERCPHGPADPAATTR